MLARSAPSPNTIPPAYETTAIPIRWPENVIKGSEEGWTTEEAEYTYEGFDPGSLHGYLANQLVNEGFAWILYDHGSGEIADFIAFEEVQRGDPVRWGRESEREPRDAVRVYLFHVKKAGGKKAGNRVADAYGLVFALPDDLREIYAKNGIDLAQGNGDGTWRLPVPARFVIDRHGVIRAVDADPDYTRRPEPSETVKILETLKGA